MKKGIALFILLLGITSASTSKAESEGQPEEYIFTDSGTAAEESVRDYLSIEQASNPNIYIEADYQNKDENWVVRVYQEVIDEPTANKGHTVTYGWYTVSADGSIITE